MSRTPEDLLIGVVALALVPAIAWTIRRGLRSGRLPLGRAYVRRDERAAPYYVLLALYAAAMVVSGAIAAVLLLELELRGAF